MAEVKLAITSDLNLSVTPPDRIAQMARQMAAFSPDAVVVAGDLAESLTDLTRCLKLLREPLRCPIWVLPGDHDFWARPPYDSRRLFHELLPKAAAAAGCDWLEGTGFALNGVGVAGTVGWYDYSTSGMAGIVSAPEFAQQKYLHSADALRIDWEWTDPEFAGMVAAPFLTTLDLLQQDPAVHSIVVVTHFPILEQQLNRNRLLGFTSAYAGNLTLGKKVLAYGKVAHVVAGHTHSPRDCRVLRDDAPPVAVRVLPGEYEKPGWWGLTLGDAGQGAWDL
jgi:3',5'-cyclic AMP phosphodiesterase CpdA